MQNAILDRDGIEALGDTFSIKRVRECVEKQLENLPIRKQYHYLSRMYLWTHEVEYKKRLEALKEEYMGSLETLCDSARAVPQSTVKQKKSGGRAYRLEAYTKHYKVYAYNALFFKMLYIKTVYGSDEWKTVYEAIDWNDVVRVQKELFSDTGAVLTLSTHAINFLYHVQDFLGETCGYDAKMIFDTLDDEVSLERNALRESEIYFVTHAIIGASRFYSKEVDDREVYLPYLTRLEKIINYDFLDVSLDMKLEFLVCTRLLEYTSPLEKMIWDEVGKSLSKNGYYIVDTHNAYAPIHVDDSLATSEHRNVLAIMASIPRGSL